ncbi:MAG: glycosyltransferase [Candidatus Competibacteraceae bacterium]|nr:glycosyltransferase [Candidatus Competibacteraceae bacterium]
MTPSLVSVVVPAYNCAEHLYDTLKTVFAQDYTPIEVIIVDDGSTDTTPEVLTRLEQERPDQVRVVRQENAGSARARNAGCMAARGEFIAFIDCDDPWLPGKLSEQVAYLQAHPTVDFVFNDYLWWEPDDDGVHRFPAARPERPGEIDPQRSGWLFNALFLSPMVHTSAVMMRTALFHHVGPFSEDLRKGQDYDYWLRCATETEIHCLATRRSLYRIHPGSITFRPRPINYNYLILERALARTGIESRGRLISRREVAHRFARVAFDFAWLHYSDGDPWLAARWYWRAVRHKPTYWKAWIFIPLALLKGLRQAFSKS